MILGDENDKGRSRMRARTDRIRAEIPIVQVLADLGYAVNSDGGDREQQFSCDLHGTGQDTKPSARVYPESSSWYCFACDTTRDAVATTMVKENLTFIQACRVLEQRFHLPPLPWIDDASLAGEPRPKTFIQQIADTLLEPGATWVSERDRTARLLDGMIIEKDLSMLDIMGGWEAFDMLVHKVTANELSERNGMLALAKVRNRLLTKLGVKEPEDA